MHVLDQIARFLQTRQSASVVLEPDQPCYYHSADGAGQLISGRFSHEQLVGLLNPVVPQEHWELWTGGLPFRFTHVSAYGAVSIAVGRPGGRMRIVVAPVAAAPPLAAGTQPIPAPLAGPSSPPAPLWSPPPAPAPRPSPSPPAPPAGPAALPSVGLPVLNPSMSASIDSSLLTPPFTGPAYPSSAQTPSGPLAGVLPRGVPAVLRAERLLRAAALVLGVAIGLAVCAGIAVAADRESMLGRMFDWTNPATLIPAAICCMFFWGALLCLFRQRRLRAVERISRMEMLLEIAKMLPSLGVEQIARGLDAPVVGASPLLRRIQAVVQQWRIAPGLTEADIVLQQHVANDDDEVRSAYSLIRTFVWALPVLGLIGTVIGISLAVGGFAEFLGSGVDDVALIKTNLVSVTGGLSFAFLITLQGLLTSLLLMLAASALQTREQRLHAGLQQGVVDHFLPALQRAAPAEDRRARDPEGPWQDTVAKAARDVLDAVHRSGQEQIAATRKSLADSAATVLDTVRAAAERMLGELEKRTRDTQGELARWTDAQRASLGEAADRVAASVAEAGQALASAARSFDDGLQQVRRSLAEHAERLQGVFDEQARAFAQPHADLMAAIQEQGNLIHANAEALGAVTKGNAVVVETQKALQAALKELAETDFQRALSGLAGTLSGQCGEVRDLTRAIHALGELTSQVVASQAALQTATKDLRDIGLAETLARVQSSLCSVAGVLDGFRKPFVLQAVTLAGNDRPGASH